MSACETAAVRVAPDAIKLLIRPNAIWLIMLMYAFWEPLDVMPAMPLSVSVDCESPPAISL